MQGMIYDMEVKYEKHLREFIWMETIKIGLVCKAGLTKTYSSNSIAIIIGTTFSWNPYKRGIGTFKTM